MKVLGAEIQDQVDWTAPRLICIAGDFTKYDEHAVAQINRNIELVRYRRYGDELMVLELVSTSTGAPMESAGTGTGPVVKTKSPEKTVSEYLEQASSDIR